MHIDPDGGEPLLIFGGPYSNLQATLAMRETAKRLGVAPSQVICTGDVVAYCADPEETVELVRDWGCHVIKGNCEENLAVRAPDCGCGFDEGTSCDLLSKGWYGFADQRISDASRKWMRGLPPYLTFSLAGARVRVIHGGLSETSRFIFASTSADEKRGELVSANADILIGGHCGIPFIEKIGDKLWFNPGVIGMPANDGTPDGWYGLIEPSDGALTFSINRLVYDAQEAARRFRKAGSASPYADALVTGLWPSVDVLLVPERAASGKRIHVKTLKYNIKNNGDEASVRYSQLRQVQ